MTPRQRRIRRREARSGTIGRTFAFGGGILAVGLILGVLGVVGYVVQVASSVGSIDSLKPIDQGSTSVVYADDGRKLGFIQSDDLRTPVGAAQIPASIRNATVAIEDQRFYKHHGVDFEGVVRAAVKNISSGKTVQGGSTLTMQLVRNLYISKERTFKRKIREAALAEQLENKHPGRAGKTSTTSRTEPWAARPPWASRPRHACSSTSRPRSSPSRRRRCSPACPRLPRSTTRSRTPAPRSNGETT